jgi:hypothetical protein
MTQRTIPIIMPLSLKIFSGLSEIKSLEKIMDRYLNKRKVATGIVVMIKALDPWNMQ